MYWYGFVEYYLASFGPKNIGRTRTKRSAQANHSSSGMIAKIPSRCNKQQFRGEKSVMQQAIHVLLRFSFSRILLNAFDPTV